MVTYQSKVRSVFTPAPGAQTVERSFGKVQAVYAVGYGQHVAMPT